MTNEAKKLKERSYFSTPLVLGVSFLLTVAAVFMNDYLARPENMPSFKDHYRIVSNGKMLRIQIENQKTKQWELVYPLPIQSIPHGIEVIKGLVRLSENEWKANHLKWEVVYPLNDNT